MRSVYGNEIVNTEFVTDGRMEKEAKCEVVILQNEKNAKYEVTLSKTKDKSYIGVSVTNYFEEFAKGIKDLYLAKVHPENINWCNKLEWSDNNFEDVKLVGVI